MLNMLPPIFFWNNNNNKSCKLKHEHKQIQPTKQEKGLEEMLNEYKQVKNDPIVNELIEKISKELIVECLEYIQNLRKECHYIYLSDSESTLGYSRSYLNLRKNIQVSKKELEIRFKLFDEYGM